MSSNNSENELLGEMRDLSEDVIGTVRWSAPELARREIYDESIDVYRYSMMLISLYLVIYFCLVLELCFERFGHVPFLSCSIALLTK